MGGWLRRKAGDRKEMYVVFASIKMGGGRDTEKQPEGYWGINKRAVNADLGDESEY